jgi:hypothetical protein
MPLNSGDIVKLFYKNIHISARSKHFKTLKEGEFVLVRVKSIDVRGEGRQTGRYATVQYPANIEDGAHFVWEGITKAKNLVFHDASPVIADAPDIPAPAAIAQPDELDQLVSDGEDELATVDQADAEAPCGLRDGWKWGPCVIDGRADARAYSTPPTMLVGEVFDFDSPFQHFLHFLFVDFIFKHLLPLINSAFKEEECVSCHELNGWFAVLFARAQWGVPEKVFWQLPIGEKLSAIMDPQRFNAIWKAMDPMRSSWGHADDPHRHVTPIIEAFNQHMLKAFRPGQELCLDECMLLWLGKVYLMDGWVVHERKPDPKGYEFKAVCDVETSLLLQLELCGSEKNKFTEKKEFFAATKSRKLAQILRMCKPWFNSGRTVTADSGFGSPAAVAALRHHGLFSNMMLKKARYWPQSVPEDILEKLPKDFDSVISCTKRIETYTRHQVEVTITAHRDMCPRVYCHTMSVSTPVLQSFLMYKRIPSAQNPKHTVLELHEVQPPQVGSHYSRTRNAVDVANGHRKRPKTELVEALHCSSPQQKTMLFIFGCIEANAKVAWSLYSQEKCADWWVFRSRLVESLLHLVSDSMALRRKATDTPAEVSRHYLMFVKHWSDADKKLMWPNGCPKNMRGRCENCNRVVASVCNCSRTTWLCDGLCFPAHVAKKMKVE